MLKTTFIPIVLFLLIGCSNTPVQTEEQHEKVHPTTESMVVIPPKPSNLEMKEWLLPKKNSRVRGAPITHVMLHFTNNALRSPQSPYNMEEVYALFEEYEVSAHYMIDREGEIYLLVPEGRAAFHAGKGRHLNYQEYGNGFNDYSIGIELLAIGSKEEMMATIPEEIYESIDTLDVGYTEEQYTALKKLLDDILSRNPGIKNDREHIIGHNEYAPVRKSDPGELFDWSKIGF
ncbi:N-acetylmuramoyl-L-alanine amidase [Sutcliffiella horikoshii]|uniref:N-acetylmuramoyl-L-alanine amidase n=1 Tax=Sutcliffiella horikoshii TaxID=79883 RepID=UPI001EEF5B5B|nr:N-acetylmuramoyl-L-alanine amidase [Sutcliffiella horikoshii]MCG1021880.1 N-acetylmuramoyl-L-alanine amidase [Sutcliffiella horikoshii]